MIYGIIEIKKGGIKIVSGWKKIFLDKQKITIWGNNICYHGKKFLIDKKNYTPLVIGFDENDITYESLRKIQISKCRILSGVGESSIDEPMWYFDMDLNPYPITDYNPDRKYVKRYNYTYSFDPLNVIMMDNNENVIIKGICNIPLEDIKMKINLYRFGHVNFFKYDYHDMYNNDIHMVRNTWLNRIHYKRFMKYVEHLSLSCFDLMKTYELMDVIDINEIDHMNDRFYNEKEISILSLEKDSIIVEENMDIRKYKIDDKKYLILNGFLSSEKVIIYKARFLLLVQFNNETLKNYFNRNLIRRLCQNGERDITL